MEFTKEEQRLLDERMDEWCRSLGWSKYPKELNDIDFDRPMKLLRSIDRWFRVLRITIKYDRSFRWQMIVSAFILVASIIVLISVL